MRQDFRLKIYLRKNKMEASVLTEYAKGETVFIPRIPTNNF
jgi:hypothetical protein